MWILMIMKIGKFYNKLMQQSYMKLLLQEA